MEDSKQGTYFTRIRGNLEWDLTKWACSYTASMLASRGDIIFHQVIQIDCLKSVSAATSLLLSASATYFTWKILKGATGSSDCVSSEKFLPGLLGHLANLTALLRNYSRIQLAMLRLANDLREFACHIGPKPAFDSSLQDNTAGGIERALDDWHIRRQPWMNQLTEGYQSRFNGPIRRLSIQLKEVGLTSRILDDANLLGVISEGTIPALANELELIALQIGHSAVSQRRSYSA